MRNSSAARRLFASLIRRADPLVPLAEAALAVAWEDQGGPDPRRCLQQLDAIAAGARGALTSAESPAERIIALNRHLFDELGFRGDPNCYKQQDPACSYLDRVLERRTGLPILLSLVYLEVGWRLGLELQGLALPGHFLVRLVDPAHELYVDPFQRGKLWSLADCERHIAEFYGEASPELTAMIMVPPGRGAILARILRNLKQTYLARGDIQPALAAVERLLLLDNSDPGELRDRGLLRLRIGQTQLALEDLERYARRHPAASDLAEIKSLVRELMERLARRN